jgi:hypothetical protein
MDNERFFSVHNDIAFKIFFADERNKEYLVKLLKAVLKLEDSE